MAYWTRIEADPPQNGPLRPDGVPAGVLFWAIVLAVVAWAVALRIMAEVR